MRVRVSRESGFTLIELLVAMTAGLAVLAAALVLVGQATQLTASAQDRVDAAQRARRGVEDMVTELRSGVCVPVFDGTTTTTKPPMVSGDGTQVRFYANLSDPTSATLPTTLPQLRVLTYNAAQRTVVEARYQGTGTATKVSFPANPTQTRTLLENAVPVDGSTPVFSYVGYAVDTTVTPPVATGGMTPLTVPLAAADLPKVVRVDVAVRVRPLKATANSKKDAVLQTSATSRLADPSNAAQGIQCS